MTSITSIEEFESVHHRELAVMRAKRFEISKQKGKLVLFGGSNDPLYFNSYQEAVVVGYDMFGLQKDSGIYFLIQPADEIFDFLGRVA